MRFLVELRVADDAVEDLAARVARQLERTSRLDADRWLDVAGAGAHLGLTDNAIRGLVKRRQIPFHRTANGRLRFSVTELDHWVRTGSCDFGRQDLP